jgi:TetR/AcrR family transcriptional repressor of nem operon
MARNKDFDEDEVLNKAVCLFWHKGYNATSMQVLVDHLGISRSSLYDTYGDKHNLYLKALEYYQNSNGKKMCDIVANTTSSKEAIKQLLEFITDNLLNDKQRKGCFIVNAGVEVAPHDAEVMKIILKNEQQVEDVFFKAIEKGQKSGEITNNQDSRSLARFISNTIKGIQVSVKSTKSKEVFSDVIETTLSVFR